MSKLTIVPNIGDIYFLESHRGVQVPGILLIVNRFELHIMVKNRQRGAPKHHDRFKQQQ
jgi:hypothetical protein